MKTPSCSTNPTFIAFIDESGCDGDKFGKGSSEFLILSAAVGFECQLTDIERSIGIMCDVSGKPEGWSPPKFNKCQTGIQWALSRLFAEIDFAAAHVIIHKPSIRDESLRRDKNRLYRYASKLLLERISWICEIIDHPFAPGDRRCLIVFSQDLSRSYDAFRSYVRKLAAERQHNTSIKWQYIDSDLIEDRPFKGDPGLLLADFHASAMGLALERRSFGQFDGRPAQILSDKLLLSHDGKPFGLGYKLWPKESYTLWGTDERFGWMRKIEGK